MMKIKDYKLFLESNNKEDIDSICKKYNIRNYTINSDGTVDVDSNVDLSCRKLTEFPLKFGRVTGSFNCGGNKLTSLEGSPKWVGGYFSCNNNELITLEGSPKWVGNNFYCDHNKLTSLEDGPEVVIGGYYCYHNKLVNFKGFPEDFDGYVDFSYNPVNKFDPSLTYQIPEEQLVQQKRNKFIYWCNEYDAIDDNGNVNDEWMEEVYNKIGLKYEY